MEQVPLCRSDFAPWNRKLLSVMQLPVRVLAGNRD